MQNHKISSNKSALLALSRTSIAAALPFSVLAGAVLIAVTVLLAYLPSINGGFIWDDDLLLTKNNLINASDGLYRIWFTTEATDYWPISNTTLWIEWRLWGMNSTGYHITNLILHIVESLLIWMILRKLSIPGAFLAAMIFAVHPVNVESVAWIASRKNLMAMLFFLVSIFCFLKADIQSVQLQNSLYHSWADRWYWLSLAAFLLAMLGKGSVAVLPVLLLVIIWWLRPTGTVPFHSREPVPIFGLQKWNCPFCLRDLVRIAPFFLVAVVMVGVNVWFQTHGSAEIIRTATFTERLLGAGGIVWFYLYTALLPINLVFIYPQWHIHAGNLLWWLPLLAASILTALMWRSRISWSRPFLFAWGFFCVALLPILGITDVGFMKYSLVADRYQHIAIIAVIALVAAGWSVWHQRAQSEANLAASAVAIVSVGVLFFLTWRQCGLYRDFITMSRATLEHNPDCWMVHNNLGNLLSETGKPREAIQHFERALRIKPDYAEAHYNLGTFLFQTGRIKEAGQHFQQALALKPDYIEAHNNMGIVLVLTGQPQEGIKHYQQALRLKPDYADAHYNLGITLANLGRLREAIEHYELVLQLKPDYSEAHNNLGNALLRIGQIQEAIEHFELALQLKPDYSDAHNNLGNAQVAMGRTREAIKHYEEALRLNPDYAAAHFSLAATLAETNRLQEAIEHYERTLQIKPDYHKAHYNLGLTLSKASRYNEAITHFKRAIKLNPDYFEAYSHLALTYAQTNQPSDAIAAAQKALDVARSKGWTEQAKEIENWLNSYRAEIGGK